MDPRLNDATVVVAGGTSGTGRAAAECLVADGAPAIASLASERNTYTTGANVNVDGGSDFT